MEADNRPDVRLVTSAVSKAIGHAPITVRRFPTGLAHYVFEATFEAHAPLVVRIGDPSNRSAMVAGLRLHKQLRSRGVPLPEIVADELSQAWPYVVLERLEGSDLGDVISDLSNAKFRSIAGSVVEAQAITARIPSAGRYGYAPVPDQAEHRVWSHVLDAHLARSRMRIGGAGLFDQSAVNSAASLLSAARTDLDAQPAIAFLHDTTTKNVIVTAIGAFSGIVDVDDLCFGDPRYAAALTLASLLVSGGPIEYVRAWMDQAGHQDDRIFQLYVALFLIDFMSEHGQAFNGNQPPSVELDRANLVRALGEVFSRITTVSGP